MSKTTVKVGYLGDNILVIPTIPEGHSDGKMKKKKASRKSVHSETSSIAGSVAARNFLVKGGGRAVERDASEKFERLQNATLSDLRVANAALAGELFRLRTEGDQEHTMLVERAERLETSLLEEQGRSTSLQEEVKAYQQRIKETQKRLRDEHYLRTKGDDEGAALQQEVASLQEKLAAGESESKTASALVTELRQTNTTLQKELSEANKQLYETKCRLKDSEKSLSLGERDRNSLVEKQEVLENMVRSLGDRTCTLSEALKDAQAAMHTMKTESDTATTEASTCIGAFEREVKDLTADLAAEREARKMACEEVASMHALLSERQCAAAKDLADAAKDKEEVDHLRHDVERFKSTLESCKATIHMLETENQQLKSALQSEKKKSQEARHETELYQSTIDSVKNEMALKEKTFKTEFTSLQESLASEHRARESSLISELRVREQQVKDAEGRANLIEENCDGMRADGHKLRNQVDVLAKELRSVQDQLCHANKEKDDLEKKLVHAEELLMKSEDQAAQSAQTHLEQVTQLEQDLSYQAQESTHWRSKADALVQQVEAKEREFETSTARANEVIHGRDKQLEELADSLKTVSERFKVFQHNTNAEKQKLKNQLSELDQLKNNLQKEARSLKGEVAANTEANEANQREVARLTGLLSEKQAEIRSLGTTINEERKEASKELAHTREILKEELREKDKVANDLMAAMHSEESHKIQTQQQLAFAEKRASNLDKQLAETRMSLDKARGDSERVTDAYDSMKRRASIYQQESTNFMTNYEDWVDRGSEGNLSRNARERPTFQSGVRAVMTANRMESGRYSDRIAALLERRNSVRK
ncbi:hypothetical protein BSKO_04187 [Bryopsis sp. KO-2023]|nr:hypothetical protein BSKO_04187 [Bryopsis sp. KO-2023]